nr:hypothetical protein [uncultured Faecalibacillus sp.]
MKCLKKIAIFSLVFFVSLFFIMPVQAKSTQTYSIIYDLQDASGNKIAQVKYKNKDFTSEIGSEIKVRTTYFDKKYGDFDLVSEQSQKVEAGKDQYIFVYRTYQPITIKGKVQFTTKEGTILLQDTFDIDSSATVENPQVYAVPDSYTIGDVTYLKMPGQVSEIKSVYYNDPSDNTYSITYYNPNNTTDYDVALKYVEEGTNDVLMQKSFHVNNQDYTYVLPKTMKINDIYYGLAENQENIIHHAVSSDVREYIVYYKKMDENASYKWSIYKVDASTNKILGEVVQLEVQPDQSVEYQVEKEYKDSDGNVYTVDQGMSQVLKHSYGESEHVSYVYYNPKGYTAPKSYIVEVQYKNIATDETIASQKIEINKKDEDTTIDIVKELTVNQQQYVLVNGQSITINHSFYSPRRIYTIYYRNVNDPINVDTEIIREEVIEVEGQSSVIGGQTIYRRNNQTGAFSTVGVENRDGSENNSNEGSTSSVDGINVEDEAVPQANIDAQSQESSSSQVYYLVAGLLAVLIVIVIILKRKKHRKEV